MPFPPLAPLPPREFFHSEAAYLSARNEHRRAIERRKKQMDTEIAIFIAFGVILVAMLAYFGFAIFGWRGPVGAAAALGLFWVLVEQIKRLI